MNTLDKVEKKIESTILTAEKIDKIERIIKSCRTIDHLTTAALLVDSGYKLNLIEPEQFQYFQNMLVKQTYVVNKGLFPGTKVIVISNQNEPVMIAKVIEPDWSIKSSKGIFFIEEISTRKDYISFSILIPYESEQQVEELNKLSGKDRWNKYCLKENQIR